MSKKRGIVTNVGKGKFSYFIQLDGEGFYFNTKFEPKCAEGDEVGIEYEPKGENRGNVKNVKILKAGGGSKKSFDKPSNSGWGKSSGGVGGDRQDSIVWQHSQEMAIATANLLVAQEAFPVKGKADARRIALLALIDELTVKYFDEALDPRNSEGYKSTAEIEEDLEDSGSSSNDDDDWDDDEWD